MRLLQLVPDPLPAARVDVAVLFGKYLPREGVQCDIVGRGTPGADSIDQGFAAMRSSSAKGGRLRRELAYLMLCLRVLAAAKPSTFDLIQVRDMVSIGLLAALAARARRIPCAYWMSYLMSEGRQQRAWAAGAWRRSPRQTLVWLKGRVEGWLLYALVLPLCRHVFVQSDAMREHVARRGVPIDTITAVPMGVDTEIVRREAVRPQRPEGWETLPVIAYLGSLERARQPEVLLEMLAQVRQHHAAARLLLVGSADSAAAQAHLLERADALGLREAVHITGWLPAARALEFVRGADLAVSYVPRSQVYDLSSPTKLVESLALGVPSIGNDNPDQAALLGASAAGWLTASDAAALADAAGAILADPPAAAQRAAAGPAAIEALRSYRVLAAQVAVRYRQICAARSG